MKNKNTVFNLTMNLKAKGIALQVPGSKLLTCYLDESILNTLDNICYTQYIRQNSLVDRIINNFVLTYEDKAYFFEGVPVKSFIDSIKGLVSVKPAKKFVTYQVREKSFKRISDIKEEYGLSRSIILKHIIDKYLKENGYL